MAVKLITPKGNIKLTAPTGGGGSVDLTNYYTKEEVDANILAAEERVDFKLGSYALTTDLEEAINNIPEVDLTGYATEDYVDNLVENIQIPDVSGFQTEEQVIALIKEHGGGVLPASEEAEF